jgi:hypothetical protein
MQSRVSVFGLTSWEVESYFSISTLASGTRTHFWPGSWDLWLPWHHKGSWDLWLPRHHTGSWDLWLPRHHTVPAHYGAGAAGAVPWCEFLWAATSSLLSSTTCCGILQPDSVGGCPMTPWTVSLPCFQDLTCVSLETIGPLSRRHLVITLWEKRRDRIFFFPLACFPHQTSHCITNLQPSSKACRKCGMSWQVGPFSFLS